MNVVTEKAEPKIFYGWIIVAVSFLCWLVADAFGFYTFGLFIGPISKELGWSVTLITGAMTLRNIVSSLLGPFIGRLVDMKYGARILMPMGVLAAGAATMGVSFIQKPWQFYLLYGVVGALGMVGFGGLVTHTLIAKWFIRLRGRAMGAAAMGVSISGVIFVPLVTFLISRYGWRHSLVILGTLSWAIAFVPVVLFVRRAPEDLGLKPDGDENIIDEVSEDDDDGFVDEYSWTLKEAFRTKAMWLLLIAFNLTGLSFSGAMIHFFPYADAKGVPLSYATAAMTIVAGSCAIVKIPWGMLADRYHVRYCLTVVYVGCAAGLSILLIFSSSFSVLIFGFVYGITLGGVMVLRELLFANYFGRAFLGTIRGVVMPLNLVAMAGGPLFAAWLKDTTGSYFLPYLVFVICFLLGTVFVYAAKPPVPNVSESDLKARFAAL